MTNTLLFIQNPSSENKKLPMHLESLHYNLRRTNDVASAISLIDDSGLKPSAIVVDIPDISEQQVAMLESIEESLGIHEWVFLTYDLREDLADRLEEMAYRSIQQPCTNKRVETAIKKAIRSTIVRRRLHQYSESSLKKRSFDSIVGNSEAIQQHRQMLEQLSKVPLSTLMIKGETGTGKGHAAGVLHSNGLRKDFAFVEMNCAAMPKELVESQLFGHESGAFTGAKGRHRGLLEQADKGTLFLDEIGDMPLDVQAKLLKAIEEQSFRRVGGEHEINVDVQIFAASNRNLQQMAAGGEFREDLYHRLNVFEITAPPLREYKTDLLELVPALMAKYNAQSGKKVSTITDKAWREMIDYDWPGNVRELRNALERSVLLAQDDTLNTSWLNLNNTLLEKNLKNTQTYKDEGLTDIHPEAENVTSMETLNSAPELNSKFNSDPQQISFIIDGETSLEHMDRQIIKRALALTEQNTSKAAELLGTTRETLRYRIQKYGLDSTG